MKLDLTQFDGITPGPLWAKDGKYVSAPFVFCDLFLYARQLEAQRDALAEALSGIVAAFDAGIFVRSTAHDHEPDWAIKAFPHLAALGRGVAALAALDSESEPDYAPAGMVEAATLDVTSEPDWRISGTLAHGLADAAADRLDDDRREAQDIEREEQATRYGEE